MNEFDAFGEFRIVVDYRRLRNSDGSLFNN